jgi:hypothetical protein
MFIRQPLFNQEFTINKIINVFLKKFSQKTSYTTFGKPFIPTQKLSKFVATNTSSTLQYIFGIFSIYSWVNHVASCLIKIT